MDSNKLADMVLSSKELGFSSVEEMLLYQDICCISSNLKKRDYQEYVKSHDLSALFNKVKDMTLFNRMKEIYIYYVNCFSMCDLSSKKCKILWDKAKEEFDVEKEMEYEEQFYKIGNMKFEYFDKMSYILKQIEHRLPEQSKIFYDFVEDINNTIHHIHDQGNSK